MNIAKHIPNAMTVFLAWEKLRIIYNLALVLVVFCFVQPLGQWHPFALFLIAPELLLAGLFANLFFCAGFVGENYLCLLGADRIKARWILFILGTFIAASIAWYHMNWLAMHVGH